MKALSAIIAIIMLLLITVALAGSAYVWIAGTTSSLTSTGTQAAQQVTAGMLSQMKIESATGSKLYVRNTGKGTIEGASLRAYIDDLLLGSSLSPASLAEGQVGELTLTGLWQISLGKHTLKITTASLQLQQAVEAVPHSSAVGVWKFDEGSGTTASDSSGYGNTGTLYNGPAWVAGKFGSALQFDGVNDYVQTANTFSINTATSSYTISAWVYYKTPSPNWDSIAGVGIDNAFSGIAAYGGNRIGTWASGYLGSWINVGNFQNNWHQIVAVYLQNPSGWTPTQMYFDGRYVGISSTDRTAPISGTYPFQTAKSYVSYSTWFNGIIDEVRIYNKALTPDETVSLKMK